MSGQDNMRYDVETLSGIELGSLPPTLRFFRFEKPTVTFGRLQNFQDIASQIPPGWASAQRPTGGGLVFHQDDLCLSLSWPRGQAPLPRRPQDQYRWIHNILLEAMGSRFRMAACCDAKPSSAPFRIRECFTNPVGYDLMSADQKIVGGALSCRKGATLYQGSIQTQTPGQWEPQLRRMFQELLA
jgi:lipoate-protein ligase A